MFFKKLIQCSNTRTRYRKGMHPLINQIELFQKDIIERGHFVLKSGKTSNVYVNLRKLLIYPSTLKKVGQSIGDILRFCYGKYGSPNSITWKICGVPYGAISLATVVACSEQTDDLPKVKFSMGIYRKETKDHGSKSPIENMTRGDRIILIEDVVTTGQSCLEMINDLEYNHGIRTDAVICVVDRANSSEARQTLREKQIPIINLFKLENDEHFHVKDPKFESHESPDKKELAVSIDVEHFEDLHDQFISFAPYVDYIKIHSDFYNHFGLELLRFLKQRFPNLLLIEDAKLSDIGKTTERQLNRYSQWADLITVHGIAGHETIKRFESYNDVKALLITSMSSSGMMINDVMRTNLIQLGSQSDSVFGFIDQGSIPGKKVFRPGISLKGSCQIKDQNYVHPETAFQSGTSVVIVGKDITLAFDPIGTLKIYRNLIIN